MADWQPIDTAPTWQPEQGANIALGRPEVILGWAGSTTVLLGYWHPDRKGGGSWETCGTGLVAAHPTHWMPMPVPPA
ncbi:DUF551 domain-containing protein [Sphingomonas soli]|uniref:DUF551 domain-containing protein n=1 Tax=Sphingomonas soli TaxID=266127 RepID=UPI0012EDECAF